MPILGAMLALLLLLSSGSLLATTPEVRVRQWSCMDLLRTKPKTSEQRDQDRGQGRHFRVFASSARGVNWRSKMIRDNPEHWWAEMARLSQQGALGRSLSELLKYQGFVMGDSHPGNFLITSRAGRMVVSAYDEGGGVGPYILDFARLVMATKAIFRGREIDGDVKIRELFESYTKGLQGSRWTRPERVRQEMERVESEFGESRRDQIDRALDSDGLFHDRASTRSLNQTDLNSLKRLLRSQSQLEVIDAVWKEVDRGGSAELPRIRLSVVDESSDHGFTLMELKPIQRSDLASFQRQTLTDRERFIEMQRWQGRDDDEKWDQMVVWRGQTHWLRIKKPNVLELPYKLESNDDIEMISAYALQVAYTMGRTHALQSGPLYARAVATRAEELREALKVLSRNYLSKVEEIADSYWADDWEPLERIR